MWASGLLLCWQFWLGTILLLFFLPVMLPSEIPKLPTSHLWEGFLLFGNFSFTTPSPGWVSVPNNCVSLLSFIFCPTSFQRERAAFLGAWCPLPAFINCFVEIVQHSKELLMNLWGRKCSPCPIPPPSWDCTLLHYSCLEDPKDRGAQQATVHRVAKSWTQLKWLSMPTRSFIYMSYVILILFFTFSILFKPC